MEIAVATNTGPGAWWDQSDEVLATALDVLEDRRRAVEKRAQEARQAVTHG